MQGTLFHFASMNHLHVFLFLKKSREMDLSLKSRDFNDHIPGFVEYLRCPDK